VAEGGGGVDEWVFVNMVTGLVLTWGLFKGGVVGKGFFMNMVRMYVGYSPGPLKFFFTIASNCSSVTKSTVNSHSKWQLTLQSY
jgi:hypothetical protein